MWWPYVSATAMGAMRAAPIAWLPSLHASPTSVSLGAKGAGLERWSASRVTLTAARGHLISLKGSRALTSMSRCAPHGSALVLHVAAAASALAAGALECGWLRVRRQRRRLSLGPRSVPPLPSLPRPSSLPAARSPASPMTAWHTDAAPPRCALVAESLGSVGPTDCA